MTTATKERAATTDPLAVSLRDLAATRDRIRRATGTTEPVTVCVNVGPVDVEYYAYIAASGAAARVSTYGQSLAQVEYDTIAEWNRTWKTYQADAVSRLQMQAEGLGYNLVPKTGHAEAVA